MTTELAGRVVLPGAVVPGRVRIADGRILDVIPDPRARGPYLAPGFIDLHVHGWGGHDAMDGADALRGMARALLARGVTAFLPTAVSAPLDELRRFARDVRLVMAAPTGAAAEALGFNLEGPFLAPARRGAHDASRLLRPSDTAAGQLDGLLDGLRLITIAPELDGARELIALLSGRGVVVSLGHSDATAAQARAGYDAGARSTTHLFNAMPGIDHRRPGLAVAALADAAVAVELIADGRHVDPALWPLVLRAKANGGVLLVSDAIAPGGTSATRARLGGLEIDVHDGQATLAGTDTLAGSLIALDDAIRNLVGAGVSLSTAVAMASHDPARVLGVADRGEIAAGRRADIVELDDALRVTGVLVGGIRA